MDCASVKGANGGLHTNYRGKAQAAVQALAYDGYDFAYIHIEAPDEMGHQGNAADKIAAIENIDEKVLKTVICGLEEAGEEYRLLLLPDHPTPVAERTHTGEAVPYLLYDNTAEEKGPKTFSEKTAAESGNVWADGYKLMSHFLQEEIC